MPIDRGRKGRARKEGREEGKCACDGGRAATFCTADFHLISPFFNGTHFRATGTQADGGCSPSTLQWNAAVQSA